MVSPSYKKGGFGAGFTEEMIAQCEQEAPAIPAPGRRMGGSHTVGDVTEKLEIAIQKLQKKAPDTPLSRLYDTDLNAISDALLRTEAEIRQEFSRRAGPPLGYVFPEKPLQIPPDICAVARPEHAVLAVTLPEILPGERGAWYSANRQKTCDSALRIRLEVGRLVMDALLADVYQNGCFPASNGRDFLVFKRHIPPRPEAERAVFVDNNNVETGEITNAICKVTGRNDGYRNMSFVYTAVEDETGPFVEVILCQEQEVYHWVSAAKE